MTFYVRENAKIIVLATYVFFFLSTLRETIFCRCVQSYSDH